MSKLPFSDLETAAYCPRKLYYRRRNDDYETPESVAERRDLAFEYDRLRDASDATLDARPLAVAPERFRANLDRAARRFADDWPELRAPSERDAFVRGRECHGVVHKVLALDPPTPSMVFTGDPPDEGVWEPQSVRAVAAAKSLAWTHERPVERAYVEYPAHGVVRRIDLTTRRKAAYRRAFRAANALDGPPPRLTNRDKCNACEYRSECGVKTRSLRSLLGR